MKQETAQHTPGPWKWVGSGRGKVLPRHYQLNSFTGKGLANIVIKSEDEVWPKSSDARLIAAAPLLLEALRNAQGYFDAIHHMNPDRNRGVEFSRIREVIQDAIAATQP